MKTKGRCFVCICVGILIAYCVYSMSLSLKMASNNQGVMHPVEIDPNRFRIVVFPRTADSVERGVLLSLNEFSHGVIEVIVDGKPQTMNVEMFSAVPPENKVQQYIDDLNREIRAWGDSTDWQSVALFINRNGYESESVVKMVLHQKRGRSLEYLYRITSDGRVIPVWALSY